MFPACPCSVPAAKMPRTALAGTALSPSFGFLRTLEPKWVSPWRGGFPVPPLVFRAPSTQKWHLSPGVLQQGGAVL